MISKVKLILNYRNGYINSSNFFYLLVLLFLCLIFYSSPFLRYPFDAFYHLTEIQKYYGILEVPSDRKLWHFFWARVVDLFNISEFDLFFIAKIIYVVQTCLSFFIIFYFSHVVIRNIFKEIDVVKLKYLSLWSSVIWFTIFATHSMGQHQVWTLWYSINYQITLLLFWYILTLCIILFLEKNSKIKKTVYIFLIVVISILIIKIHAMEFLYFLMYLFIFSLVYYKKLLEFLKKYSIQFFLLIVFGVVFFNNFISSSEIMKSQILIYIRDNSLSPLYSKIIENGQILVNGFNRSFYSVNELMYVIGFFSVLVFIHIIRNRVQKKEVIVNIKFFIFISLTSLFVIIPLTEVSSGIFSLITSLGVVNRLYYSSSLFILLPVSIYYISYHFKTSSFFFMNLVIVLTLVCTYLFSKNYNIVNNNYYKNVQSIKKSIQNKSVSFHLSEENIKIIGKELKILNSEYSKYETPYRKIRFYARVDIAFVLKYIYGEDVYWEGRKSIPDYIRMYNNHISDKNVKTRTVPVLFNIPEEFPKYIPYK